MTLYQFRQGIVSYPELPAGGQGFLQENASSVTLLADNGPTVINFAHYDANYEFSETLTITDAWDLTGAPRPVWIYWDLDQTTGIRTFGYTEVEPVSGPTQPTNPANDQHWFDTVNTVMMVHINCGVWVSRIRVFAARISSVLPMGSNQSSPFAGSQVGLNNVPNAAGRILFDDSGLPVTKINGTVVVPGSPALIPGSPQLGSPVTLISNTPRTIITNGTFFTTESQFFSGASRINGIRLESDVVTANAEANMAAYAVVKWNSFSSIGLANYNTSEDTTIGILTQDALLGENVTVIIQGTITNQSWSWDTVGAELWVSTNGVLVDIDPNISSPVAFPNTRAPVARVLSRTQIIFMQGLGSIGPAGPVGPPADQVLASTTQLGNVLLTFNCGGSPLIINGSPVIPLVVSRCDPILSGGPFAPLAHLSDSSAHDAGDIVFSSAGNIAAFDVQAAIEELDGEKVAIDGDTMTGFLFLNANPTEGLHAATKTYVDNLIAGLIWLDPIELTNMIADNVSTAPLSPEHADAYRITGTGGAWSSFANDDVVYFNGFPSGSPAGGGEWVSLGQFSALNTLFPTLRFGIAFTSSTTPSGNFAGSKNGIAVFQSVGSPVFEIQTPSDNNAVFVDFALAPNAFRQYVFNSQGTSGSPTTAGWTLFGGGSLTVGSNLTLFGNIVDVKQFDDGGTVDAELLQGNAPSAFAPALHTHNYDLAAFLAGAAVVGDIVASWILTRDLSFPAGFTGSAAKSDIAGPTSDSTVNILRNGAIVGTVTFPTAVNTGVFASSTVTGSPAGSPSIITNFLDGDLITMRWVGSPSPDSLLKDVSITIETCASAPQC